MLLILLFQHPAALPQVLQGTPTWVWGLLAALLALGASQLRGRTVGVARMAAMPLAMAALSLWGTVSAFNSSPLFAYVLMAWLAWFALAASLTGTRPPPAGMRYDAASRSFQVPGSWVPLLLILCIFAVKYVVGADLAMQPALAHNGGYTLVVGALYGVFSGCFAGRAARLWRLALRPAGHAGGVLARA